MFQALWRDVRPAEQALAERFLEQAALGHVQAIALLAQAALTGEGHLLVLHGVESRKAPNRNIWRNRLGLIGQSAQLRFDRSETRDDKGPKTLLSLG